VVFFAAMVDFTLAAAAAAATRSISRPGQVILGIAVVTVARSFAALTSAVLYFDLLARKRGV
jgi:hypothetical protein